MSSFEKIDGLAAMQRMKIIIGALLLAVGLNGCRPTSEAETVAPADESLGTATTPAVTLTAAVVAPPKAANPSDEFFAKGRIPQLRIRLTPKEEQQLRNDQRRYVDCTLIEDGQTTYKKVKVKLKGAAGSFRNLDDKPAFTLSLKKKDERFHGMDKFHLNNSVQDESYLNELLASQLCLEAGCPAARVTHARVWLNDRDLGFYVLKEGFDKEFLERHFGNAKGNLYDGGFCQDIDAALEKDEGEGPDDLSDLKALVASCHEGDATKRWQEVANQVDIGAFLNFVALELMMSHWDGYAQNRNNYRVYFRDDRKAVFLPHGMDQMFGDPNFGVFHVPGAMVAKAVLENPEWQARYRQRVRELLPSFATEKQHARIDEAHARIRPVVAAIHEDRARHLDDRVREVKSRVNDRAKNIRSQFPPEPIAFNAQGVAKIEDWEPRPEGDTKLEKQTVAGRACLVIATGPSQRSTASFRTKVRLARGKYQLEAKIKATNITALGDDRGPGAGVRISGGSRTTGAVGNTDWQTVAHAFEVNEDLREVEVVAELRSTSGEAAFDLESLRVVKAK